MDLSTIVPEVLEHAKQTMPQECCGIAIVFKGRLKYIPCTNQLSGDVFCISPDDYLKAEAMGEIVGICHSHVNISAHPSEADKAACEVTGLPWLIVSIPGDTYYQHNPTGIKASLIGRPFYHGVYDCYSLLRDYYKEKLNIELNDYKREVEWWEKGYDLYEDNFRSEGFVEVDIKNIQEHDIILMQNGSDKINHAAIYLGDGIILHHCVNRLSSRDVYGGYWLKNTRYVIRHKTIL